MMVINGLPIPEAVLAAIRSGRLRPDRERWRPRDRLVFWPLSDENFGHSDYVRVYGSVEAMEEATAWQVPLFADKGNWWSGHWSRDKSKPPYIPDSSKVMCIGEAGFDNPICLDFQPSVTRPQVIMLNDLATWEVIAPDFESFLALFDTPEAP
jgi:hypothetical protein